ncbi:nucleotide pyrophosphohydrolase [Streptomyces diastaticus]|uniref:nucleotide pyrophosphohydrolase n=1 Tax=Streptomyces diastaticus TaxID=1956 RepID=UPI00364784E8
MDAAGRAGRGPEQAGGAAGVGQSGAGPGDAGALTAELLQRRLARFAAAREWGQYHTPKNLAAALSVEASELLEIFQWLTPGQAARIMDDPENAFRVRDEVADVLAYTLQLCEVLGIDALEELAAKIERNERRFPAGPYPLGPEPSAAREVPPRSSAPPHSPE